MITGFNTNVEHRGVQFHLQTEDSGVAHPHVISHLYHGGTILASEKSDYADLLEDSDLEKQVRALMESQHGSMLERLKEGGYDPVLAERLGDAFPSAGAREADVPPTQPTAAALEGADGSVTATDAAPQAGESPAGNGVAFSGGVTPEPLDRVIADYLVQRARGAPRGSRSGA